MADDPDCRNHPARVAYEIRYCLISDFSFQPDAEENEPTKLDAGILDGIKQQRRPAPQFFDRTSVSAGTNSPLVT